jgi:hypothetical protein
MIRWPPFTVKIIRMVDHHLFLLGFVVGMELAPVAVVVVQPAAGILTLQVYNSGFLGFS